MSCATLLAALFLGLAKPATAYDVVGKDIVTLQADMTAGRINSAELVRAYLDRISALDRNGPQLNAVLSLNPDAMAQARALDLERRTKGARGPLHGIPILIKDNIETADAMPTTAGSLALAGNITRRDAPVIAQLREAGVIVLGKANLSEWANIRSSYSISGWSGLGGRTKNPYVLDRSSCGSSAGSSVAVAASFAAAALGTETNGSLVCPGSFNGIVALKPTVGLVSRTHIIPISHTQDTAGPLARTVADAALLLEAMAGSDAADPATYNADAHKVHYAAALKDSSLAGKRLGVIVPLGASDTDHVFAGALRRMREAGAQIIQVEDFTPPPDSSLNEAIVLKAEFKHDIAAYLATLSDPGPKTLADLIAFNSTSPRELALFGQDYFEAADASGDISDSGYLKARENLVGAMRALLDRTFDKYHLDALIRPTDGPAFRLDTIRGNIGSTASAPPAMAGYPHLTLPMGMVRGLPVGSSFIGPAWSEAELLELGSAFERLTPVPVPKFLPSLEQTPEADTALAPSTR